LEKVIFRFYKGGPIRIGEFVLKKPRQVEVPVRYDPMAVFSRPAALNLFFETEPRWKPEAERNNFWRMNFRLLAVNDAGETFENTPQPVEGTALFCLGLNSYPRADTNFSVRLLRRVPDDGKGGLWQTIASFRVTNPNPQKPEHWVARPLPITNELNGIRAVLGGVTISDASSATNNPPYNVRLWMKFLEEDGSQAYFRFRSGAKITDSLGNDSDVFWRPYTNATNDWITFRAAYELGTNRVWRLKGRIRRYRRDISAPTNTVDDGEVEFFFRPGEAEIARMVGVVGG
jgi:hypothetical protein